VIYTSYCYEFIKKFRKEGNFCGLDRAEMSRLEAYIEIVDMLMKQHRELDEKKIIQSFPLGAARVIIPLKDERRTKGLCFVADRLLEKKRVTARDLQSNLEISKTKSKTASDSNKSPEKQESEKPLTQPPPGHPNHGQFCPQPGTVPVTDAPPQPSLAEQCRVAEGPVKSSPFQTAAELKAHEADPLGVDQMFPPVTVEAVPTPAAKTEKDLFMDACQQAYEHGKPDFRQAIDELMQYHPSWKNPGTVIYFCVTNPKEALTGRK
jgi:hypothetical protein